jgi:MFS family permease
MVGVQLAVAAVNPSNGNGDKDTRHRWLALGVLCTTLLLSTLDNTVLNVALPTLSRTLGASMSQLQWIVDAYTVVFAGLLLTAGGLGDRWGRKGLFMGGLAVFGSGSAAMALCAADVVDTSEACRATAGAAP